MPRPVHFEIHADDVQRAIKFYGDLFGWKSENWGGPMEYWLVTTGDENEPGINGAIMKRPDPAASGVNYINVDSIEQFTEKTQASGGTVVMPKMAVPNVGYVAVCKDTEGNDLAYFKTTLLRAKPNTIHRTNIA